MDSDNKMNILIELYTHNHQIIIDHLKTNNYNMHSNLSNFTKENKKSWSGLHNDYLFRDNNLDKII